MLYEVVSCKGISSTTKFPTNNSNLISKTVCILVDILYEKVVMNDYVQGFYAQDSCLEQNLSFPYTRTLHTNKLCLTQSRHWQHQKISLCLLHALSAHLRAWLSVYVLTFHMYAVHKWVKYPCTEMTIFKCEMDDGCRITRLDERLQEWMWHPCHSISV